MNDSLSLNTIGKNAGLGKDSAGSDYLPRRQFPYITPVLIAVCNRVYGVGRFVYSLFGMGMQRVDAERLECGEPSPLCVV
jgi:hypothetical protein